MSRAPRLASFALLCAALPALLTTAPVPAQDAGSFGRTKINAPERSDEGDWYGTWFFVSRSRKMALWIRETDGVPQMRLRLQEQAQGLEGFTTDWETQAKYSAAGLSGSFVMAFDQRDENTLTGEWTWTSDRSAGGYSETARFEIYRSGWGRQMVWKVDKLERKYHGGGSTVPVRSKQSVWTFRKASRREVLWAELPF